MPTERTLVIIKPDGVMMEAMQGIVNRYEAAGLRVIKARYDHVLSREEVHALYREHEGKFYFPSLVLAMTSGPTYGAILEGENAIEVVRKLNGATDPAKADPGTIRYDFRSGGGPFNTVHASDSPESFAREVEIYWGRQ